MSDLGDFTFDEAFGSRGYALELQVHGNLSVLAPSFTISEGMTQLSACRRCGLSQVGSPSAFAKYYEATPTVGQSQSQLERVNKMKKQMEGIKATRQGKKSGRGEEALSELLKAVKFHLERLKVKEGKDNNHDHGLEDTEGNGDLEKGREEAESGEECCEVIMTPVDSEIGEGESRQ